MLIRVETNSPALWRDHLPKRADDDHKYARGSCFVWSGPALATGAARLSARAALRVGAGLVTIAGDADALLVHAAHLSAIMLREAATIGAWRTILADRRIRAVILGPASGIGRRTRDAVRAALAAGPAIVLDADALTSFEGAPESLFAAIRANERPVILTPHAGEFRRLFADTGTGPDDHIRMARNAATLSGAIILRKGHASVIAAPDGRLAVNTNATPSLATAGSGDVLAGIIGGLLAQGMPGYEAACAAAWLHGEAGAMAGVRPIADDLVESLARLPAFETL